MLFDHKIVGAGEGKQQSQLNIGKDMKEDFRKGEEGGAQIEPLSSPGHCREVVCIISR